MAQYPFGQSRFLPASLVTFCIRFSMSLSISAVLELCDQGKNTREIAKELSLRDIGFILKKGQRIISRSGKDRIGKEEMDLVRTGNR